MVNHTMGAGELAVHNCYVKHRKKKATVYIGKLAGGAFVLKEVRMFLDEAEALRAEVKRLDSECSELYAALHEVLNWTGPGDNRAARVAREYAAKVMVNQEKHGRLLAEVNRLKQELADERELPTIAYMGGYHDRDDEVRALRTDVVCLTTQRGNLAERAAELEEFVSSVFTFHDSAEDIEKRMLDDARNCCPACGGSGHIDDYTVTMTEEVRRIDEINTKLCSEWDTMHMGNNELRVMCDELADRLVVSQRLICAVGNGQECMIVRCENMDCLSRYRRQREDMCEVKTS